MTARRGHGPSAVTQDARGLTGLGPTEQRHRHAEGTCRTGARCAGRHGAGRPAASGPDCPRIAQRGPGCSGEGQTTPSGSRCSFGFLDFQPRQRRQRRGSGRGAWSPFSRCLRRVCRPQAQRAGLRPGRRSCAPRRRKRRGPRRNPARLRSERPERRSARARHRARAKRDPTARRPGDPAARGPRLVCGSPPAGGPTPAYHTETPLSPQGTPYLAHLSLPTLSHIRYFHSQRFK